MGLMGTACANPGGMTVQSGLATITVNGNTVTIVAADNTHLNWQSFNIASGESTIFQQPSSTSIVWNNIGSQSASQIYGTLQANGVVVLMNSSGFYFGPNSFVKAAGLVVSTAPGTPVEGASGANWLFTGPPPTAKIVNYGQITSETGGYVYLIGADLENQGTISTPGGSMGLCAGNTVLLSERPDGRGLSAKVTLPSGTINNGGRLNVDGGSLLASAKTVNQNGVIEANSVNIVDGIIELSATENVKLGSGSSIQASSSQEDHSQIKIEAGKNITISSDATVDAGDGWGISMKAGYDSGSGNVIAGTGTILFSGNAAAQAKNRDISLATGDSITVNSGSVRTVDGGSITATAVSGSVKTGSNPNGYDFRPTGIGYVVDSDLGGISTANGGDVTITAGKDIVSYLPVAGGVQTEGGTGCFGTTAGNLTLKAGNNVTGHYVVANGNGTIEAGNNAGTTSKPLALSLVKGGWKVNAENDIILQEIRNPNGTYNNLGSASSSLRHFFDYSSDSYAILTAGNSVQLLGSALPRYDDSFEASIPCIYPCILEVNAGAGGISIGSDIILFPSASGWLKLSTTDGGDLKSTKPGSDLAQIILSDSSKSQYLADGDFGINDHASTPIHINDLRQTEVDISGNMDRIYLISAESARVNIGGNMIDSRFDGQNLHNDDVSSINVTGNIENRSEFTSITVGKIPDFNVLLNALPTSGETLTGTAMAGLFYYDKTTKTLTFQGRMTTEQLQYLLNLQVQSYDAGGQPILKADGTPVTHTAEFIDAATLKTIFATSQDIPSDPDSGFRIGGGGSFKITAANLDLGATAGIVSMGAAENSALARYFNNGAAINVNVGGKIDMFSTTISCLNGGDINVQAGGAINLGSDFFSGDDQFARGIFSTCGSDVTVVAGGDIVINGSRIATYDGGNIAVKSLHGNIEVGKGGQGSATVIEYYVDPVTRKVASYSVTIPGSGILATTFPKSLNKSFPSSQNTVGDILVETPEGNITATSAGIVQVPLNGTSAKSGSVTLTAGTVDASGSVVHEGSIDVSGSGVIGANVSLKATGDIKGTIVARNNLGITSLQSVMVAAYATGDINVNAANTVSGTLIGVNSINLNAGEIDASLQSQNVNATGHLNNSEVGFSPITVANSTSQSIEASPSTQVMASQDDDEKKKLPRGEKQAKIKKLTGRVTVLSR